MKRIIAIMFLLCLYTGVYGQIAEGLVAVGFENVRTLDEDDCSYVSWENNVFRSSYTGVSSAIRSILGTMETGKKLETVLICRGIPQLHIAFTSEDVEMYKNEAIDFVELIKRAVIDYDTDDAWKKVSTLPVRNRASWKPDFVIAPGLYLENSTFDVLYNYSISLLPALEMELWKGAKLSLQSYIPIASNSRTSKGLVQPGYLTLSQDFDLKSGFKLRLVAGNFNANRAGGQAEFLWRTKNGRFEAGARAAATVQSIVTDYNGWSFSKQLKGSGAIWADYYVPSWNSELKAQFIRYVTGYNGVRADFVRHFGEYTIGLYGLYVKCDAADNNFNGGFSFSIPLPGKKYMKNKGVRIRPSREWNMEYSIKAEWNHQGLSDVTKDVHSSYDYCDAGLFLQPDYIRHFMIREYEKGKQR